jgi:hypothetical protein
MNDSAFRERRVPPEEVKRILKRAAELSSIEASNASQAQALTVTELEERLKALGISDDVARRALEPPMTHVEPAADGAIRVEREVTVDGMLGPEHFERIAELITARMKPYLGSVSSVGNKLTWSPGGIMTEPQVTVHSRNGVTTIRYRETLANRGQTIIGFGTLSAIAGAIAGTFSSLAGVAIAKAADISKASGAPVVLGAGIALGIAASVGSFIGLKRTLENRAVTRTQFADGLLHELSVAVNGMVATEPVRARVDASAETAAEIEAAAQAEAEAETEAEEEIAARARARD